MTILGKRPGLYYLVTDYSSYTSDPYLQNTIRLLLQNAIVCSCGGMNVPIATTDDEYRCLHCDHLIKNRRYNLGYRESKDTLTCPKTNESVLNMQYYEAAIELLKTRNRPQNMLNQIFYRLRYRSHPQ